MSRGIVTCAGGKLYFLNAYLNVWLLRQKGCALPVEWFYMGAEMSPEMLVIAGELPGVKLIDLGQHASDNSKSRGGWQSKVEAICRSSFDEVLWVDADSFAVRDPSYLFDAPQYQEHGVVFWPDPYTWGEHPIARGLQAARDRFGVPTLPDRQTESGQMLFDKRRVMPGLERARLLNRDWQETYRHLFGDKDTFPIGMLQAGLQYAIIPTPCAASGGDLLQHDFAGNVVFVHLVGEKFQWNARFVRESVLPGADSTDAKIAELRRRLVAKELRRGRGIPVEDLTGHDPEMERRRLQQGGCCN